MTDEEQAVENLNARWQTVPGNKKLTKVATGYVWSMEHETHTELMEYRNLKDFWQALMFGAQTHVKKTRLDKSTISQ